MYDRRHTPVMEPRFVAPVKYIGASAYEGLRFFNRLSTERAAAYIHADYRFALLFFDYRTIIENRVIPIPSVQDGAV